MVRSDRLAASSLLEPRNPRRLPDKHEEVEVAAAIGERGFVLLAELGDERHRAMIPPRYVRDDVEILHDLLDRERGTSGPVQHGVALVLQ